jgi:hypothetical protein
MKTRRRTFGLGLITALIATAPFAAYADDDHNHDDNGGGDDNHNDNHDENNGNGNGNGSFRIRLVRVSDVNGGTGGSDFTASNPGTDSLEQGDVAHSDSNVVHVHLQGAQGSSTYDVQFERLQDHGREDLGNITTNSSGNFNGSTPNGLGSNRVGVIVLSRGGQDQFVSAL